MALPAAGASAASQASANQMASFNISSSGPQMRKSLLFPCFSESLWAAAQDVTQFDCTGTFI